MRAALATLLTLTACGPVEGTVSGQQERALFELERLCFVPKASYRLWQSDLSLERAIVFDRFEFTRADLRYYWPQRRTRADEQSWHDDLCLDAPERADWPAVVDFHEAGELAALRGMRLPTPVEWLHVALGRRDYQKPWGGPGREFFANTIVVQDGVNFSLNAPSHVGTYENGRSRPFGCYDLLGNVWEWVDGRIEGFLDVEAGMRDFGASYASTMGGAYDSPWRYTYELDRAANAQRFHARAEDKRTLSPALGVRMCAEARPYLLARAREWGAGPAQRARVVAVGRRWARDDALARSELRTLLAELRAQPGAPVGLEWLEQGVNEEP